MARSDEFQMRLTRQQQQIIKETAADVFGTHVSVYLFGSRVDDSARGGDIDLLVRLDKPQQQTEQKILQFVAKLQMQLGDQPIDVLVQDPESTPGSIHLQAQRTGVKL
jgi:predicted nucleotidyltransferase